VLYLLQENTILVMIVGLAGAALTWGLAVARVTITVMDDGHDDPEA
jgi:uncharacterized membrane protein